MAIAVAVRQQVTERGRPLCRRRASPICAAYRGLGMPAFGAGVLCSLAVQAPATH
jgi:hypothetical protein